MPDDAEHSWHDDLPKKKQRAVIFPLFGASADQERVQAPDTAQRQSAELLATIIRADGTVHELGQIAGSYKWSLNPKKLKKKLHWDLIGKHRAAQRSRAANRHVAKES